MTRNQLLKKRAHKAHQREMYSRHVELSSYNPLSAADHINRVVSRLIDLGNDDNPQLYYDRLIEMRRLHRDILAVAEHMVKNCPKNMVGYFQGKCDDALEGIKRCNERIK